MSSVLLSSTDETGLGLGDLCRGPASSMSDPVGCLHLLAPSSFSQCTSINGKCPRAGVELGEESCPGACEDNRASGEAEPPPVALLVPILAQGDVSRMGWQSWGQRGAPAPQEMPLFLQGPLCVELLFPEPQPLLLLSQPLTSLSWSALGNIVSGMRKHSVIP